jgi:hypothetical protein
VSARTAIILIVISLAAVAGVAYGSYRSSQQSDGLEVRVAALERAAGASTASLERLETQRQRLCASADRVRQKITGVALAPDSPAPNFDFLADPLSASERIILMLYNWCHAGT